MTSKSPQRWVWAGVTVILLLVAGILGYRRWIYGTPHFAYASLGRMPDEQLPTVQPPMGDVDLSTSTVDDFPEFLGPGRRGAIEHIHLEPDWAEHPPRLVWRQAIGAGYSAFSVVNGYAVTLEQRGEEEQVTCYEVMSGRHCWTAAWQERFTIVGVGPRSTPTLDGGRVYALGAWGHLVCLDGHSGRVVWQRELLSDLGLHWNEENRWVRFGRSNSPLVVGQLVIVPGGGGIGRRASLLAYDTVDGKPRWRGGNRQISYSSPVLAELLGEKQVLIVNEDTVSGHDLNTGAEWWSYPWPGDSRTDANVSQPVPVSSNRVLMTKGYRQGAALIELARAGRGGSIRVTAVWRNSSVLNTKFTNVTIWDHHVFGLSEGTLECVRLETGERRWKSGYYGQGQILRVRDLLLVLGEDGELFLVRLDPLTPNRVMGRLKVLTGLTWNTMALYGRYLLVRNAQQAACYELPTRFPSIDSASKSTSDYHP